MPIDPHLCSDPKTPLRPPAVIVALLSALLFGAPLIAQPELTNRPEIIVRSLVSNGGRMAWSRQGDRLAFDAPDSDRGDGLLDVYILDDPLTGGTDRRARCITCTAPDLRRMHSINPAFHPSGETLVFQTMGLAQKTKFTAAELNTPTRSNRSEIWLARTDGKDFWKLTDYAAIGGAVLDPSFSYEGERLLWAEQTSSRKGRYGAWRLRSGAIRVKRGVPKLSSLTSEFEPNEPALMIPHGFTLDDRGALFSANLIEGQSESGVDVYVVREGKAIRLTRTGGIAEEVARIHPDGDSITFTSSQTLRREQTADGQPVREIWSMSMDGSEQQRLTFFNEPPADEYRGATFVGDIDWHPDGSWLAAQLTYGRSARAEIVLIQWTR